MNYSLTINGGAHILAWNRNEDPPCSLDGVPFSAELVEIAPGSYSLLLDGKSFWVRVAGAAESGPQPRPGAVVQYQIQVAGATVAVGVRDPRRRAGGGGSNPVVSGAQRVTASMPGKVVRVLVAEQQRVEAGQSLVIVEAMKMQNEIRSPKSGIVQSLRIREGQAVNAGELLLTVE